jgi:two-component system, OmpR family, sensor kinase
MFDVSSMKLFKSIKWRLQLWYGLILVVVLAGFGFTALQLERGRQMRRIDDELQRRMVNLGLAFRPPAHGPEPGGPPFGHRPPNRPFDDAGPRHDLPPSTEFNLPPQFHSLFSPDDPHNYYFIINRDGKELARSTNAPDRTIFSSLDNPSMSVNTIPQFFGVNPAKPQLVQTSGKLRENFWITPLGNITVGCSIAPELKELRLAALRLTAVGSAILLFGLAGGWWISSRAIRPIADISATAAKISAGDLSQRISTADADSELGQLAGVLNATFARLDAAFAQQRQFTADAAHELRTPVSVMLTQTQTALNRERSGAEYRETLEACQRSAQRMRRLIESLLELARLDAGQEPLKRMPFNLSRIVLEGVELVRPLAIERGVTIQVEAPPFDGLGDAERMTQVITNLLTNAIQYSQPGGEVRIVARRQDGMAVLTVADTGHGIAPEDLPHVFERFYRGDKSRAASSGNAGLGLAIAKAIVEAHSGTIEVASQSGVGTTFTVRLPV